MRQPRYFCELYQCGHTALLVHAHTVAAYRALKQGGVIGLVIDGGFSIPLTRSQADVDAAERALVFDIGLFADPIFRGDYPAVVKELVGPRLPAFTAEEKALLIANLPDWFMLNHYTSRYEYNDTKGECGDSRVCDSIHDQFGVQIGPQAESPWLYVYPPGIRGLIKWVWKRYGAPILVTENGMDRKGESSLSIADALQDTERVEYYRGYLDNVQAAVELDGVDVRGYCAWSALDSFEWSDGYTKRFGLHYVESVQPHHSIARPNIPHAAHRRSTSYHTCRPSHPLTSPFVGPSLLYPQLHKSSASEIPEAIRTVLQSARNGHMQRREGGGSIPTGGMLLPLLLTRCCALSLQAISLRTIEPML